jgi:hypothetical protein
MMEIIAPAALGEGSLMLWLLVVGVKAQPVPQRR